jgi:hypothetical protein
MSGRRNKFANFRVSEEEKTFLEFLAKKERVSVSGLIRQVLSEGLVNQDKFFQNNSPSIVSGEYQQNGNR